jgi:hypothetical protein
MLPQFTNWPAAALGSPEPADNNMTQSKAIPSIVMCAGLACTYFFLPEEGTTAIYRTAAIGAAFVIALGILMEAKRGIRALIRTDLLMLVSLYGLTLVEFLFPQQLVEGMITAQTATRGVEALFLGFCGLIIGRNLVSRPRPISASSMPVPLSPKKLFWLYLVVFSIGYLNMLLAVGFDPRELVNQMVRPRFTQPWTRGTLGGWADILGELGNLLLYLLPPIAGSVLADRSRYSASQIVVVILGLAFTLFYGFSSGTRNLFAIYLILFVGSYVMFKRSLSWLYVGGLSCLTGCILYLAAYHMLQFREVGLATYIESGGVPGGFKPETLFIDNNLPVISRLTEVFPGSTQYLGMEVVYNAILRPVPRALWPDKPVGLSVETADALGVHGLTVSSTFVGEAYMMDGYLGILVVGLLLGWLGGWWNRFGQDLRSNVNVGLYASGFFAAMLSMRSILWLTTAMLPSLALWLYLKSRERKPQPRAAQPMDPTASD